MSAAGGKASPGGGFLGKLWSLTWPWSTSKAPLERCALHAHLLTECQVQLAFTASLLGHESSSCTIVLISTARHIQTIVDMSCGSGLFSRRFARSGKFESIVAADFSESMLNQARLFFEEDNTIDPRYEICDLRDATGTARCLQSLAHGVMIAMLHDVERQRHHQSMDRYYIC